MSQPISPPPPEQGAADTVDFSKAALIDSTWQRNILRPILIILLTIGMLMGPVTLAQRITSESRFYALIPLFFFVAIISVYTRIWLADPRHRWFRETRTRLGEIVLLLMLLRLVVWYIQGQRFDTATLQLWLEDPVSFFDNLFIYGMLLMLVGWRYAGAIALTFVDLGLRSDELVDYRQAGLERSWVQAIPSDRKGLLDRFTELWMWGGIILVVSAALSRVQFAPNPGQWIGLRTLGLPPEILLALLVYFIGGLFLLSQGRLAVLRARWHREHTPGIQRVTRHWQWRTIKIILAVAVIASLLPFGSSFGLAVILTALISVIFYIYLGFVSLIALLLAAIAGLFGMDEPQDIPATPPPPIDTLPPTPEAPTIAILPSWAPGAMFWVILILLALYLIIWFLRRRNIKISIASTWWNELLAWWFVLRGHAERAVEQAKLRLATTTIDLPLSIPRPPWRFVRLRGLSATERTRYFYLSTVRRAGELGVRRNPSQTPLEYEDTLAEHWPDLDVNIEELTHSFLHARYSAVPVNETEAGRARQA